MSKRDRITIQFSRALMTIGLTIIFKTTKLQHSEFRILSTSTMTTPRTQPDEVPITFKSKIDLKEDVEKVTLVNMIGDLKKKAEIHQAHVLDPELIIRVIDEFHDIMEPTRLNLSTGPLKFEKFRECLTGIVRDEWDLAREGQPLTNAGFRDTIAEFIATFLDEDDYEAQRAYVEKLKKPYAVSVRDFYSRLKFIIVLMKRFPGAPEDGQIFTVQTLKTIFQNAMPMAWQDKFNNSGLMLMNTQWPALIRYYSKCRAQAEREREANVKKKPTESQGSGKSTQETG